MTERALSSSVLAAIASGSLRPFLLYEGEYVAGESAAYLRLWTGVGTLEWDGKSWTGGGELLSISPIRESASLEAIGFSVRLSGMPADKLSLFLQSMRKNKAGRLWLGFMEPEVVDFRFTEATLLAKHGAGVATITFTRSGATATRVNEAGLIETVAADTPRFDYDPVTLECKGLLIEEARTNLCVNSNDFSAWSSTGGGASPVQDADGPLGPGTAWTLTDDDTGAYEGRTQSWTVANDSLVHILSVYVEKNVASPSCFAINFNLSGGTGVNHNIRLNTGSGQVTGGGSPYVEDKGDFWRLVCSITNNSTGNTALSASVYPAARIITDDTPGAGDTPTATGSAVATAVQLEKGAFVTSYIPTTSAAVTRNADVPVDSAADGWLNAVAGTILVEAESSSGAQNAVMAALTDGTSNERIEARYTGIVSGTRNEIVDGGVVQASLTGGAFTAGQVRRTAFAFAADDAIAYTNGGLINSDVSVTLPTVDKLWLGHSTYGAPSYLNGHLRRFTYYPKRLPNATLQQISAVGAEDIVWGTQRIIPSPYPLRRGRFDMAPISRDPTSGTMTIEARYEGPLARLLIPNVRHYTHEDQQLRLAGDKGFDQVEALQDTQDIWGPEVPVFAKTTRSPRPDPSSQTA